MFIMRIPKLRLIILLVLLLFTAVSVYASLREDRRGILTVAFLDVGQGDAIFIEAPGGNQLLIDGGLGRGVLRELSKVMPFYDRSLDVVLATHPDADHIGGLPDVLDKYEVGLFLESGVEGESAVFAGLNSQIQRFAIQKLEARRGMVVDLGQGASLEILFPDRDPSGMETNTASIVARLVYGENEFLLTGDSPSPIENYLISLEGEKCQGSTLTVEGLHLNCLQSDVLKAGHHGSKTSTGAGFLAAVSPQYVVISAGRNNRYGHPSPEVLEILNNFGAQILRTDQNSRIIFKSDGADLKIAQ